MESLTRMLAVASLCLLTSWVTACGGDGQSEEVTNAAPVVGQGLPPEVGHPVTRAIDELQQAFVARDHAAICAGLTDAAADQVGLAAHGQPTRCERDLRRMLGLIRRGNGWRHEGRPRVIAVDRVGAEARATVALDEHWRAQVPMALEDGRWRLDGMFGDKPLEARQASRALPGSDFPPLYAPDVEVTDVSGSPCPALAAKDYPGVSGGCVLKLSAPAMPVVFLTPFGDFKFGDCSIDYRVHVDSSGRTWTDKWVVAGDLACADINSCDDYSKGPPEPFEVSETVPWRGVIRSEGDATYLHEMDMCLQTCVGYFIGKLNVRLTEEDGVWRAEPIDGGGDTGFHIGHRLRVRTDVEIDT